jgi:hypothetical protein
MGSYHREGTFTGERFEALLSRTIGLRAGGRKAAIRRKIRALQGRSYMGLCALSRGPRPAAFS